MLKNEKKCIISICISNIALSISTIILTRIINNIFNEMSYISEIFFFICCYIVGGIFQYIYTNENIKLTARYRKEIVNRCFEVIDYSKELARISKIFETDLDYCIEYNNKAKPLAVTNLIFIVGYFVIILQESMWFAVVILLIGLLQVFGPSYFASLFAVNYVQTVELEEKIEKFYYQVIANFKKAWFFENEYFTGRLKKINYDYYKVGVKSEKIIQIYKAVLETVSVISEFGIYFVGVIFIAYSDIAFSTLLGMIMLGTRIFDMMESEFDMIKNRKIYEVSKERIEKMCNLEQQNKIVQCTFKELKIENFRTEFLKRAVSFEVGNGEIFLIKGENGVGKSTVIKAMLNLQTVYEGKILIDNVDTKKLDTREMFYYVPQNVTNINYAVSELFGQFPTKRVEEVISWFGLDRGFLKKNANELSSGENKKIQLMCGFMSQKAVLIFDEPENLLDEESRKVFIDCIKRYEGTVLIVTNQDVYKEIKCREVRL